MKKLHWSLLVACALLCSAAPLSAQSKDSDKDKSDKSSQNEKTSQPDKSSPQNKSSQNEQSAYLGVAIESVHHGVARHMGDKLKRGQGLLVVNVHDDSPADKAGIKEHDILTSVDDQRLYSEEQFAKIISHDKPGAKVKIDVLRDGKSQTITATLGERPADFEQWAHHPGMQQRGYRGEEQADDQNPEWQSFDAMTLKKTGKNTFKVEISYLDDKGKTQKHSFEGTRADIRKQIRAEKDMRPIERHHLIRSLDLATGEMPIFFFPDFGPGQGNGQGGGGDEGDYQ